MAYRELELTLLSAQELKNVNLIARMDVYAVVSISGDPLTRQCTQPDTYGGRNPCWKETFRFAVPPTAAAAAAAGASLQVLLRAERFLGDRDVGEVVVPLSDILATATGAGPQPPQLASYQVRKLHRWEPRGVLNVSYRLGPVVAPAVERAPDKPAAYVPVGMPSHHPHPSARGHAAGAYEPTLLAAPGRPAARVAEQDKAAQNKSPVMAYDAYRQPTPTPTRPAPRAPTPAPAPPNARNKDGLGQAGPTHVYMVGPQSQINIGPAGKKGDGNRASLHDTQGKYASAAESMSSVLSQAQSQSQNDTQQQRAASSRVAAPSHPHRLAASPFSSRNE